MEREMEMEMEMEMEVELERENGEKEWGFIKKGKKKILEYEKKSLSMREMLKMLYENVNNTNENDDRSIIHLEIGDPTNFPCFRTSSIVEDSVIDAIRSACFNGYAPFFGLPLAKKAIAEYISKDLPFKLSAEDVYLTVGVKQGIQAALDALAHPDANILLPRPTFPMYDSAASFSNLQVRHYDLLPENGWEIDLDSVEALADENTVAIVVINPGNPCGNVYSYQHLEKVAETARKLGLLVISDEVYDHITFGKNPFIRMGVFASKVPVLTLGSISKRWVVPGWRFGWLITTDPNGILQNSALLEQIKAFLLVNADPPTFIQAAVPEILENTKEEFFSNVIDVLSQNADILFEKFKEIPNITLPNKPQGSMFALVKINTCMFNSIQDDFDFTLKLAKQEKVLVLPGDMLGMKNWVRITFALEPSILEEGLNRIISFCQRNAKDL